MWVFLGMETIANIKYRSHVDSDSCLLAVCRWLIPHEVAPQQSFTMLQPANAKVIIKNGTTKNNHIYFILQFDPLKHSINNSSCNLTYTPKISSPILPLPEIVSCLHLSFLQAKKYLEDEIMGKSVSTYKLFKNLKYFIENYYNDISVDAEIERQTLINLLTEANNQEYEFYIDKLMYIGTHKGSIISRTQNFGDLMMKLEKSNMDKLIKLKFDDNYVEKVKLELSDFPYDLYDIYLQRPYDFLSNVYYSCLSRETISKLLSGIIFIDANENRNIDKHLKEASEKVKPEYISKEKIIIPNQIKDNNDKQSHGIINNEEVFIKSVNKSIVDKSQAIIWRVLYSILKTHNKFGYNGNLKDYYNDICVGKFNVKVTYNALSKTKGRYSFYKNDELIESKVKKELPEIKRFYDCVDEYFKSKMNEYIN